MSTRLTGTLISRMLVIAFAGALGCGGGTTAPDGDAGSELDAILAEERAACAHLFDLGPDACPMGAADEAECAASLAQLRVEHGEPDCLPEHRAWVACIAELTECDTSSGTLCPEQYSALGLCAR